MATTNISNTETKSIVETSSISPDTSSSVAPISGDLLEFYRRVRDLNKMFDRMNTIDDPHTDTASNAAAMLLGNTADVMYHDFVKFEPSETSVASRPANLIFPNGFVCATENEGLKIEWERGENAVHVYISPKGCGYIYNQTNGDDSLCDNLDATHLAKLLTTLIIP